MDIAKLKKHGRRFKCRFLCALVVYVGFLVLATMAYGGPPYHSGLLLFAGIGEGIAIGTVIASWSVYNKNSEIWLLESEIELLRGRLEDARAQNRSH